MSEVPSYDPSSTSMFQEELEHMTDDLTNEDNNGTGDSESSSEDDDSQQDE